MDLTGLEASVNALPPGRSYGFSHAHKQNEELYLLLTGAGEMLLDGQVVPVGAGTALRIAPAVFRCWRNTGSEPLTCVVVQAKSGSLEQATHDDGIRADQPPRWPYTCPGFPCSWTGFFHGNRADEGSHEHHS
jgi:mannose-6-phosphate isomerase-like protein (cupin superfamily)